MDDRKLCTIWLIGFFSCLSSYPMLVPVTVWQCDSQCDTVTKPIIWNLYLFRFQMEPHTTKQFRGSSPTTNGLQTSVTWKSINTIRATTIHWLPVKMVGTMTRIPFRHPSLQTLVECDVLMLIISLNSEVLDSSNEFLSDFARTRIRAFMEFWSWIWYYWLDTNTTMFIGQPVLPVCLMVTLTVWSKHPNKPLSISTLEHFQPVSWDHSQTISKSDECPWASLRCYLIIKCSSSRGSSEIFQSHHTVHTDTLNLSSS